MSVNFRERQEANRRKTLLLLAMMGSLTAVVVWAAGAYLGYTSVGIVPIAVGISLAGVWWSYYASDRIVLTMTGARVVDEASAPQLYNIVHLSLIHI